MLKKKISAGFESVNDFISYSLSVQNRRKSRAGFALENHVEFIFKKYSINYSRGKITENYSRPDFIFPGIDQYHNNDFPSSNLSMLGVKSTCKDRWRQILAEAKRIDKKHLLTLEPGISNNQTDEMKANKVQLIVPKVLLSTYTESQKRYILNFKSFIQTIQEPRKNIGIIKSIIFKFWLSNLSYRIFQNQLKHHLLIEFYIWPAIRRNRKFSTLILLSTPTHTVPTGLSACLACRDAEIATAMIFSSGWMPSLARRAPQPSRARSAR